LHLPPLLLPENSYHSKHVLLIGCLLHTTHIATGRFQLGFSSVILKVWCQHLEFLCLACFHCAAETLIH
jgi:hypothetical protein